MQNLSCENEFYLHENKNHFHIMVSHLKVEAISKWLNLLQSEILSSSVLVQMSSLNGCSVFSCAGVKQHFFRGGFFFERTSFFPILGGEEWGKKRGRQRSRVRF